MSFRQGSMVKIAALLAFLSLIIMSCGKSSAPPPPKKVGLTDGSAQGNPDLGGGGGSGTSDDGFSGGGATNLSIKLKDGGTTINGESGDSLKEELEISGANSASDVYLALSSRPEGLRISGRNSLKPTISWLNPKTGKHKIKFVLRDAKACIDDEGDKDDCELDSTSDGDISASKSYDRESSTFTIDIERGSGSDTDLNNGGGDGGNKSELISKILGLLTGGGGGGLGGLLGGLGGGGGGDLGGLLGGLNTGQLQGLLGGLNNGGGAGDFQNILGGLLGGGGFGLTGSTDCDLIEDYIAEGAQFSTLAELESYVSTCGLN